MLLVLFNLLWNVGMLLVSINKFLGIFIGMMLFFFILVKFVKWIFLLSNLFFRVIFVFIILFWSEFIYCLFWLLILFCILVFSILCKGLIIEYGRVKCIFLLLLFSLMWNEFIIIILLGFMILVSEGFIFEFRKLNFIGNMVFYVFCILIKVCCRIICIMWFLVGVNLCFLILMCCLLLLKKLFISLNISLVFRINNVVFLSGLIWIIFSEVGM